MKKKEEKGIRKKDKSKDKLSISSQVEVVAQADEATEVMSENRFSTPCGISPTVIMKKKEEKGIRKKDKSKDKLSRMRKSKIDSPAGLATLTLCRKLLTLCFRAA